MRFSIIIPNYNNAEWLDKCISSVLNQTYKNYQVIIVDDCSTDNSVEIIEKYPVVLFQAKEKAFNGGARNMGISLASGDYILFLDSDDWFISCNFLKNLNDFIIANNEPDCIRLPFKIQFEGDNTLEVWLNDDNIKSLVDSCYVACWTKCVKRELVQLFPENTLMEDVVQHIKQCDNIKEVIPFNELCVMYNRNNTNSCSIEKNWHLQNNKWQSSMYRYCADLMDFTCKNEDCENHRKWRLEVVLNNIKEGKYLQ